MTPQKWIKSSRSGDNGSSGCIEVAFTPTHTWIQDTKNRGPHCTITPQAWTSFLTHATPDRKAQQ
ncbi:DUF397 domain-containing protein [Actinokineospora sp. UTMC 2448]|uniref:DUF397 domain-containing protein n=1 Tax=Actinokineospora sp. UTMC 2448 TaxID=2268449 RepID=UPI0021643DFE|nr:DUF397 domain-containing protein [Actinokineospora sp. UTMC 2448]